MATYNRFQAFIMLLSLLVIVSSVGFIIYNFARYHILQIKEENLGLEVEKESEALEKLPRFDKAYPEGIDYKKPLIKIAEQKPKRAPVTRPMPKGTTSAPKPRPKGTPFHRLMKCWKCQKPFTVSAGTERGRCPHCGAEWALK